MQVKSGKRFYKLFVIVKHWKNLGGADEPRLNFSVLSAYHSPQHPASTAEHEHGKKVPGYFIHAMIGNQGHHNKDEEIQAAHQKPPQEFLAPFPFPSQKTGKKGNDYVDTNDADGHNLFRQAEAVEKKGQQKEQSGGE